jgi:alanine-glyoxylate transaminase/serine-glyoxylate transaminase/serine-pyruvate transaminase
VSQYSRKDPLLMIPGPTPLSPGVRAALAAPLRSHGSAENAASLARIREGLRRLTGMGGADVFVFPGSGTLAMEAAVINHARRGERVVIVNHGFFADRFVEICAVHGLDVDEVRAQWGRRASLDDVRAVVERGAPPALVILTHVDTSTGVRADVASVAAIARGAGAMVLLDGVCSTGGMREDLDDWGVDLLVTAPQKALAAPPGLALVVCSPRARERRQALGRPAAYYLDLSRWDAPMTSTAYFATHAVSLVRALDVSVDEIFAEGLDERFRRHLEVAELAREGFNELHFTPLTEEAALASTLTVLAPPAGVDETRLRQDLLADGVLVAAGIGAFAGRGIRVGHMGAAGRTEVMLVLDAVRRATARQTVA